MTPGTLASAIPSASASASASAVATAQAITAPVIGTWGEPPDTVAWLALAFTVVAVIMALAPGGSQLVTMLLSPHRPLDPTVRTYSLRRYLTVTGFVAAFLSLGFIEIYLRGGPRIIDATTYFLQGRALSHGNLAWHAADPSALDRGRFLFFREPDHLAGIFPPGYPMLLALGFRIGAPMVVGPLLAAALVAVTYLLTAELFMDERRKSPYYVPEAETVARFGAAISVFCATLRYHTADTMSHAASALGIALSLACALRARRLDDGWLFALSGVGLGYVACTRTVSSFALALVVVQIAYRHRRFVKSLGCIGLGALPGIFLLLAANHQATGYWLWPAQRAYYAVADGPADCFRYGFGANVGCIYEHGDFVKAHLANGYGFLQALGTTARRLRYHLLDGFNFELVFVVVLYLVVCTMKTSRAARAAGALVLLHVLAYAPFYFDGNYPGGGARLFADVLPVEHALAALAIARAAPKIPFSRRVLLLLAAMTFGFAVHESFDEHLLADRDGGRPAYEPDLAREATVDHGLFFLDSDAAFNLAYEPEVTASHGVMAVRLRNDDHDRLVFDALGHPTTHVYRFAKDKSSVESFTPTPPQGGNWRFEAESDYPAIAQTGGWALPAWVSGSGASQEKVLELTPEDPSQTALAEIELPLPPREPSEFGTLAKGEHLADWRVEPSVLLSGTGAKGTLALYLFETKKGDPKDVFPEGTPAASWTWSDDAPKPAPGADPAKKAANPGHVLRLDAKKLSYEGLDLAVERIDSFRARLVLTAAGGAVALDKTMFLKVNR